MFIYVAMYKEPAYNKKEMPKRRPPIKPFVYVKYLLEYREEKGGMLRIYKEHIENYKEAGIDILKAVENAEAIKDDSLILQARLYLAINEYKLDKIKKDVAVKTLGELSDDTSKDADIALVNFHIWQINQNKENLQNSIQLYKVLYKSKPSYYYKKHLDILQSK